MSNDPPHEASVMSYESSNVEGRGRKGVALRRDVFAGLMFVAFGLWGLAAAADLEMGTLSEMGPAYSPRAVSGLMILLGLAVTATGFSKGAAILELPWALRPILMVTIASLAFALLLERAGIVLAITATVFIGILAGERLKWLPLVALTVALIIGSIALFIWALGMRIPVWPNFSGI
jgi:hypothetical protein